MTADPKRLVLLPPPRPEPPPPAPAVRPTAEGEGETDAPGAVSPTKLLHGLRRRWRIAVPLALAAAVTVGGVMALRLTPIYTARTLLRVPADRPTILYDDLGGRTETSSYQRTQVATVKSRLVGEATIQELGPRNLAMFRAEPDPAAWVEKQVKADFTVAPEILKLTIQGSDPDELLLVLNTVREAYLREVVNRDRNDRASRLRQLTELTAGQETALAAHRQKMSSRAEALGARDLTALRARYEHALTQSHALKTERLYYRALAERGELEAPPPPAAPPAADGTLERLLEADPTAAGLRADIARLEPVLADLRRRLRDYAGDPEYVRLTTQLTTARAGLSARRDELQATAAEQALAAARAQAGQQAAERARMITAIRQHLPQLDVEIQRREREEADLARGLADLDLLRGEITVEEDRVKVAHSRIKALEVELQAPPRAQLLEEAVIVETPKWDRPVKMVAAPAVAAFALVLLLVAWLDARAGRVDGPADLEAGPVPVLGAVPSVRGPVLTRFIPPERSVARREYLRLTDAVEMARAVIGPVIRSYSGYVLAVTSAAAGEGKTTVSGHLAARLARSGCRTLLIDANTRRARPHEVFGPAGEPGFTDLVLDYRDPPDVIRPGPIPGLDVIAAGAADPAAAADLLEQRLPDVLRAVKPGYDVVILDTPPLLLAPEGLIASRAADGVVLAVMRDVSRLAGVQAGYERLRAAGANVLGAVVSGSPAASHGY
jgi:capsular exopolysaccharide synthesis family protein